MSGIYHEWNGTVLTITSDSGTSSADLKGAKGDIGVRGAQGVRGRDGNTNIISVNGQTGAVILGAEEVGALPSTTIIPSIDGLATEEFVVQKVTEAQMSGADVDLSAYYTKTETEALVSDAVIQTQVLLSDYATNEALALQTSQTKLYVDSADNEVRAYAVAEDNKVKQEMDSIESNLMAYTDNAINSVWDIVYPVGSIYMSVNSASPASVFGGSWERIKDTFLLATGNSYAAGSTGGEATHTLTVNEMPNHKHNLTYSNSDSGINWSDTAINDWGSGYPNSPAVDLNVGANWSSAGYLMVDYAGGNQPHNNMPPYLAVYMWKRVA